jgi:hypothetical protein
MDAPTRKFITACQEFLDDVQSRQHMPVSDDFITNLNGLVDEVQGDSLTDEISPGEQEAIEASNGYYGKIQLEPEDNLSPGERAVREAVGN